MDPQLQNAVSHACSRRLVMFSQSNEDQRKNTHIKYGLKIGPKISKKCQFSFLAKSANMADFDIKMLGKCRYGAFYEIMKP